MDNSYFLYNSATSQQFLLPMKTCHPSGAFLIAPKSLKEKKKFHLPRKTSGLAIIISYLLNITLSGADYVIQDGVVSVLISGLSMILCILRKVKNQAFGVFVWNDFLKFELIRDFQTWESYYKIILSRYMTHTLQSARYQNNLIIPIVKNYLRSFKC